MTCVIHCYALLAIVSNSYPRYKAGYYRITLPFATHPEGKLLPAFYLHVLGAASVRPEPRIKLSLKSLIISSVNSYRRLTIYSCKLTGYNVFYHNPLHLVSYSVLKGLVS